MIDFFRKTSQVVLDFVFGASGSQPESLQMDSEAAWQRWLNSGIEPDEPKASVPGTHQPRN